MDRVAIFSSWDAGWDGIGLSKSKSVQCRRGWDRAKQSEQWNFIRQKIVETDFRMAFLWYSSICLVFFRTYQGNSYKAIIPTAPPRICLKPGFVEEKVNFTSNKALGREWNSSKKCASAELFS